MSEKKRIPESEYTGPVYWPNHTGSMGDDYFADVEEVRDYCERRSIPLPIEVESCSANPLTLDADDILDTACENSDHWDGMRDSIPKAAEDALRQAIDAWNRRDDLKGCRSWMGNGTMVVLDCQPTSVHDHQLAGASGGLL